MAIQIFESCGKCHGDGQFPNAYINFQGEVVQPESTVDCPNCEGTGKLHCFMMSVEFSSAFDDLVDKVNDCLDKLNDIKEKIDEL